MSDQEAIDRMRRFLEQAPVAPPQPPDSPERRAWELEHREQAETAYRDAYGKPMSP